MGLFDSQIVWNPVDETPTGSGDTLNNLQKLTMGSGSSRFEANIKDGLWLGADTFATAPFSVDFLGALTASSVTIKTSGGTVLIDSDSSTANYLEVLNSKMSTISKEILSDFDFGSTDYAGAVKAGDITWNTTTGAITGGSGTVVYRGGIVGAKAGATTFSISSVTGDAVFGGSLSAATGTLGALTIASGGNIKLGKTAYSDTSNAGFWMGDDSGTTKFHIGASATNLFRYNGSSIEVIGGTITGATVQTASSGERTRMTSSNGIEFMTNTTQDAIIKNVSGNLLIDADNLITIQADGSGDDVSLKADDLVYTESDIHWSQCDGYRTVYCDNDFVNFNDDNTGAECQWVDRSDVEMKLTAGGDLYIDGTYYDTGADYGEYFESLDGDEIPLGISVVNDKEKIRPAKNNESPFGVISATASIVGNAEPDAGHSWHGKYLTDDFGKRIMEKVEWWSLKVKKVRITKGKEKQITKRISNYSDIEKPPKGAKIKMAKREKINPEWNPKQKYIPRKDRPEWNVVGLLGRVRILKGQPTNNNWIKLRDISDNVEEWLIK